MAYGRIIPYDHDLSNPKCEYSTRALGFMLFNYSCSGLASNRRRKSAVNDNDNDVTSWDLCWVVTLSGPRGIFCDVNDDIEDLSRRYLVVDDNDGITILVMC